MPENGFLRTEIWHALSVHFPIALLLVSTLITLISFFIKENKKSHWQNTASGLLYAGCAAAWISIYTGDVADGIVARKLCDPTILKDHEIAGKTMTYLFSAAALLNILTSVNLIKPPVKIFCFYLSFLITLAGSGYLVYAGRLGASLVYQQGAGVYKHVVDCDEYETEH